MKVRLKNTVFDHPKKAEILALLDAQKVAKSTLDFDAIRLAVDETLQDGTIHQIALDAGYTVEM